MKSLLYCISCFNLKFWLSVLICTFFPVCVLFPTIFLTHLAADTSTKLLASFFSDSCSEAFQCFCHVTSWVFWPCPGIRLVISVSFLWFCVLEYFGFRRQPVLVDFASLICPSWLIGLLTAFPGSPCFWTIKCCVFSSTRVFILWFVTRTIRMILILLTVHIDADVWPRLSGSVRPSHIQSLFLFLIFVFICRQTSQYLVLHTFCRSRRHIKPLRPDFIFTSQSFSL